MTARTQWGYDITINEHEGDPATGEPPGHYWTWEIFDSETEMVLLDGATVEEAQCEFVRQLVAEHNDHDCPEHRREGDRG